MQDTDSDGIILFILGTVVAIAIFSGIVYMVKNAFQPNDKNISHVEITRTRNKQSDRNKDVRQQQKMLIEQNKQRLRDSRR